MNDLRFAFRQMVKNPVFTAVVVLSLALGIGVNTLVFRVVNATLLQPIPVESPERVVNLYTQREGVPYGRSSYPDYQDMRDRADGFSGVSVRCSFPVSVGDGNAKAEVVLGNLVSGNYFEVLGVKPRLGRTFSATEGIKEGADPVLVLSHRFWTRRLAADPNVVGQSLLLNARAFTVIGVAPHGFTGLLTGMPVDAWIPITMKGSVHPGDIPLESRDASWLDIVARLKDGLSLTQAQAAVDVVAASLAQEYPDDNRDKQFVVVDGRAIRFPVMEMARGVQIFMGILTVVGVLILLLTCSNVANLFLSRAVTREQEISMRLALGASRGRVLRQLLVESVVLALCGGAVGVLFASGGLLLLGLLEPPSMIVPVGLDIPLNGRVFAYTAAVSALAGCLFGLAPAWRSSSLRPYAALRSGHSDGARRWNQARLQRGLVGAQVALSFILLLTAGLCVKSLQVTLQLDPGFETRHCITAVLNLRYGSYEEQDGRVFFAKLLERVRTLPGAQVASLAVVPPLSYVKNMAEVRVEGYEPQAGESLSIENNLVSSDYFATLGIPILQGRSIDERDQQHTDLVVVVNETMARRFWGAEKPLGQVFTANGDALRIVGVARDARYFDLNEAPQSHFYVPLAQAHCPFASLLVKSAGDPHALIGPVLNELERLDPNLPIPDVKTLSQQMELQYYPTRIAAAVVGAFGLLALALATVGVYAVMAYAVRQRSHELGVRTALGASRQQILSLVLRQGMRTSLIGAGVGLAGALGAARLLSGFMQGVNPIEPAVFAGVAAVLGAAALTACYLPARRAARVDPIMALRCE